MNMSQGIFRPHLGALVITIASVFLLSHLAPITVEAAHAKGPAAGNNRAAPVAALLGAGGPGDGDKKPAQGAKNGAEQPGVQAKAVYCVNLPTSQILMARNADQQLPVASLSKLVTALVALDHFPLTRKVKVPEQVKGIPKSVVGLKAGDTVSVKDLLHGLLIGSGNDCAETLAAAYPGGKVAFVRAMNKKAAGLGTKQTHFYTPSGLDRKITVKRNGKTSVDIKSNVSTAREIAHIARHAFSNKTIRVISLKRSHVIASATSSKRYPVRTTNKLLRDKLPIIGGKTGYTCRAGQCMATSFTPGRDAILIVVLGSTDHFRDTRLVYHSALEKVKTAHAKGHPRATSGNDHRNSRRAASR